MDKLKALQFAELELSSFKEKAYSELSEMIGISISKEHNLEDGNYYQTQIQVFWDDSKEKKIIRVSCNIDDGGLRAYSPLNTDFLIQPNGQFIE